MNASSWRYWRSMALYDRAVRIFVRPDDDPVADWLRQGRLVEALAASEEALARQPDAAAHLRHGNALRALRRCGEALAAYDRAIALAPGFGDPWFEKSTLLLLLGDYARGWRLYEWRWWTERNKKYRRQLDRPLWLGETPLSGKTILLHAEQGYGDLIQFARYVPMVAAQAAKVVLGVSVPMAPLLKTLPGACTLISTADQVPPFDCHAPLMSLPLAFDTRLETIPAAIPYLYADPGRRRAWQARLGPSTRPRIGLAWSGSAGHHSDQHRSMSLHALRPLLDLDAEFHSLQKEIRPEDQALLAELPMIRRHETFLQDFADTAALIAELDQVIAVDTAVAHLAAALGKPTWILLAYLHDYRWLLGRSDTPWYPGARLFRQRMPGAWPEVVDEVRAALLRGGIKPQTGTAALQGAAAARQQGRPQEAERLYRQVLQEDPRRYEALYGMAVLCGQRGHLDEALRYFDQAAAVQPHNGAVHYNRARVLHALRRYQEALAGYGRALSLAHAPPAELYYQRGNVLEALQRPEEALRDYRGAVALRPDGAEAHFACGNVLQALHAVREALIAYDRALSLKRDDAGFHHNRAAALETLGHYEKALAGYERALALRPALAEAHSNRGNCLQAMGRYDEARAAYDSAVALKADFADAHNHRGNVLQMLHRYDESLRDYDRAITLQPDFAWARYNKALLKLLLGDYDEGWRLYESRWRLPGWTPRLPDFAQRLWLGKGPVAGKTVLLHAEQGLGDVIQFVRYAPRVAALGARVILAVPAALGSLLMDVAGVTTLVKEGEALPPFDLHCPLMSLPLAFHTELNTIPAEVPYLSADPVRRSQWRTRLGERARPRIGLVWSGNPQHRHDRLRSLPLRLLEPLLGLDAEFHSLQKEVRPEDAVTLAEFSTIRRHEDALEDFADTAALIAEMDQVIAVDTAVAHLTGALGKPLWLLLPHAPDWRWLLERSDSPWYPSARLFRQRRAADWESVIAEVREALAGKR
jgi:tetratricopeptide (TPR) repeat protein